MEEVKADIVRLCQEHPEGLTISQLQSLYRKTHGKPLVLGDSSRQGSISS